MAAAPLRILNFCGLKFRTHVRTCVLNFRKFLSYGGFRTRLGWSKSGVNCLGEFW